jgi:proteasome assembly chaperone 2
LLLQHAPPLATEHQADLNVNLISHETHRLQQSITYPQEETSEQKMVRGVGKSLLSSSSEHKINTALVLVMCNEGDNTPHGIYLAQLIAHDIIHEGNQEQLSQIKWKVPSSWSYLFGPPADSSLY